MHTDSDIVRSLRIQLNSCCLSTTRVIVSVDHSASNHKCCTHTHEHSGKAALQKEGAIRRLNTCMISNIMTGLYSSSRWRFSHLAQHTKFLISAIILRVICRRFKFFASPSQTRSLNICRGESPIGELSCRENVLSGKRPVTEHAQHQTQNGYRQIYHKQPISNK